jgi:chromosome segregation ATPase
VETYAAQCDTLRSELAVAQSLAESENARGGAAREEVRRLDVECEARLDMQRQALDEVDRLRAELTRFQEWSELRNTGVLQLRAELVEKQEALELYVGEMQRLRAELAEATADDHRLCARDLRLGQDRWERAEAAIARVREVCANPPVPSRMLIPLIHAAIEGSE